MERHKVELARVYKQKEIRYRVKNVESRTQKEVDSERERKREKKRAIKRSDMKGIGSLENARQRDKKDKRNRREKDLVHNHNL